MKTLTITEARENLGQWLKAAARGEDVAIISGADIIGLRRLRVKPAEEMPANVVRETAVPHPAIGIWKDRREDGVTYQRRIRREWDGR